MILIYCTHKNKEEAEKIAKHLLEKKLIACANFLPIESAYLWKGKVESGKEYVSLLKTQEKHWSRVKEEIEKIHPYEIPCILKIHVEANSSFEKWIQEETQEK